MFKLNHNWNRLIILRAEKNQLFLNHYYYNSNHLFLFKKNFFQSPTNRFGQKKLTLLDSLGGDETVRRLVGCLLNRLAGDPVYGKFSTTPSEYTHKEFGNLFRAILLDRPFKEIKSSNVPLFHANIGDLDLKIFSNHLKSCLEEIKIDPTIQHKVMSSFDIFHDRVMGRERPNKSLFERLGGESSLATSVNILFDKILQDSRISHWFDKLDIKQQREKMIIFLKYAMGGADSYNKRDLETAHADLVERGLSDEDYNIVIEHLRSTFVEIGVHPETITEAIDLIENLRDGVLCKDWWF
jgi:hemoglobin